MKYVFGIDVGGTTVKCGLFEADGDVIDKWEIKTRTEDNGCNILPDIAKTIDEKLTERVIKKESVIGVGIGVPGPVNDAGEMPGAVNLHWGYKNLVKELGDLTGLPVKAGNDANVAALGEMWKGGGAGCSSIVMVTLGTGVGGGIINNGKIVTGANGAAGEIGHMHVTDDITIPCNCGNTGCLEQVASATGITFLAKRRLSKDDKAAKASILRGQEISAKSVFDAVKNEDKVAIEIAEEFGEYLGCTLANIANVVNPEMIVIGGGVSKAGEILFDFIRPNFVKNAFMPCKMTGFALAKLGNDAGIYGAAKLML